PTANASPVHLCHRNARANQQSTPEPHATRTRTPTGRSLDDPTFATTNGTLLAIWDCNAGPNPRWTLPSPTAEDGPARHPAARSRPPPRARPPSAADVPSKEDDAPAHGW
ncbi:hypothetical protein VM98_35815, partial [Streptomyces rubellomurinus subsp. indigoferus]